MAAEVLLLTAPFLLALILCLTRSKRQQNIILARLHFRHRRTSGASTPPRSLSPEKACLDDSPSSATDYKNAYPPSRRGASSKIAANVESNRHVQQDGPSEMTERSREWSIPTTTAKEYFDSSGLTPTGFSSSDLEILGDFPDYAKLSGVPLPNPYADFDISKATARPYRPFRWAYHQTMSLSRLEPDWWLELEQNYAARIAQRKELYGENGKTVLDYLPGSELACKELMEMCLQFLCARYPHYFSLSPDKTVFHNGVLHTTTKLRDTHPLHVLLDHVPEDFAIMLRNADDGLYYFRAGVICSALGWNVGTKIGLPLHEIHGPIPDYKEKMQFSMDRYFSKLPTDRPIQRGSWGLEIDQPLFMPPGHPHELLRLSQSPSTTLSQCHLRVDWQTLRRLPLSGSIIFNFKALFTPVEQFRDEPYIPALLGKILREGKESLMRYKNTWHVEHVVVPKMREWEREQVEKGLVEEGWEVRTLEESPWFPGWEGKWREEQGF